MSVQPRPSTDNRSAVRACFMNDLDDQASGVVCAPVAQGVVVFFLQRIAERSLRVRAPLVQRTCRGCILRRVLVTECGGAHSMHESGSCAANSTMLDVAGALHEKPWVCRVLPTDVSPVRIA